MGTWSISPTGGVVNPLSQDGNYKFISPSEGEIVYTITFTDGTQSVSTQYTVKAGDCVTCDCRKLNFIKTENTISREGGNVVLGSFSIDNAYCERTSTISVVPISNVSNMNISDNSVYGIVPKNDTASQKDIVFKFRFNGGDCPSQIVKQQAGCTCSNSYSYSPSVTNIPKDAYDGDVGTFTMEGGCDASIVGVTSLTAGLTATTSNKKIHLKVGENTTTSPKTYSYQLTVNNTKCETSTYTITQAGKEAVCDCSNSYTYTQTQTEQVPATGFNGKIGEFAMKNNCNSSIFNVTSTDMTVSKNGNNINAIIEENTSTTETRDLTYSITINGTTCETKTITQAKRSGSCDDCTEEDWEHFKEYTDLELESVYGGTSVGCNGGEVAIKGTAYYEEGEWCKTNHECRRNVTANSEYLATESTCDLMVDSVNHGVLYDNGEPLVIISTSQTNSTTAQLSIGEIYYSGIYSSYTFDPIDCQTIEEQVENEKVLSATIGNKSGSITFKQKCMPCGINPPYPIGDVVPVLDNMGQICNTAKTVVAEWEVWAPVANDCDDSTGGHWWSGPQDGNNDAGIPWQGWDAGGNYYDSIMWSGITDQRLDDCSKCIYDPENEKELLAWRECYTRRARDFIGEGMYYEYGTSYDAGNYGALPSNTFELHVDSKWYTYNEDERKLEEHDGNDWIQFKVERYAEPLGDGVSPGIVRYQLSENDGHRRMGTISVRTSGGICGCHWCTKNDASCWDVRQNYQGKRYMTEGKIFFYQKGKLDDDNS